MYSLRQIISALTFIGVAFHEFGHQFFCKITGVRVHKVCYFRIGNPAGYVIHDRPNHFMQSFLITVGPFITGALLAVLFFYFSMKDTPSISNKILFIWLGGSVAVHSFPSDTDAKSLWQSTNRHIGKNLLALLGYPVALIILIANRLNLIFIDLIYAVLLYVWAYHLFS